jgi:hypothetical protein
VTLTRSLEREPARRLFAACFWFCVLQSQRKERVPQSLEELCLSLPPRVKEPVLPESGRLPAGTAPAASDSGGAGFTGRKIGMSV